MLEKDASGHPEKKDQSLGNKDFRQENYFLRPEPSRLDIENPMKKTDAETSIKKTVLSPQDIHTQSLTIACDTVENVKPEDLSVKDQFSFYLGTKDLIEVDVAKGNTEAAHQRLEKFEKYNLDVVGNNAVAYYKMGSTGDIKSLEKLSNLLTKEKTTEQARKDPKSSITNPHSYEDTSFHLQTIVHLSAKEGLPADDLIDLHAINSEQSSYLKLQYYEKAKNAKNTDGIAIGKNYKDEVTNKFLAGIDMSNAFAARITRTLWDAQEDTIGKQQILERFKDLVDFNSTKAGLKFLTAVLYEPEHITPQDAAWAKEFADNCKGLSKAIHQDPFTISRETQSFDLALAHYYGATPAELVTQINETASYQNSLDIPESSSGSQDSLMRNKDFVDTTRDAHLSDFATFYAEKGNFEGANVFLNDISNATIKSSTLKRCLKKTKTNSEVAAIIPDDILLTHDRDLKELFNIHVIIKSGDLNKLAEHTKSLTNTEKAETVAARIDTMTECLTAAYKLDYRAGAELGKEISKQIKETDIDTRRYIANTQLNCGDEEGLRTLFELAARETDLLSRFAAYADVAKISLAFKDKEVK